MSATTRERGNPRALALATIAYAVSFYAWSMLGPLGPHLKDELRLSAVQLAAVVAVPVLMGSLMRIPLGILTDRLGGRWVLTGLMAFTILPLAGLAVWYSSFPALIVLGFLLGLAGASFAIGVPLVNRWYPPGRQGRALGIYGIGMGGTTLAGLTAPRIADRWGVRAPFLVAIGLLVVTIVIFAALARDAPGRAPASPGGFLAPLRIFRRRPAAWAPTFYYFLVFGGFVAMFAYLPVLLTNVHHLDKPDAASRAAGFALVAVVARPIGGVLSDRIGPDRVLAAVFAAAAALAVGLSFGYGHMLPLTICALALAGVFGLGTAAVLKLVADEFPRDVGAVTGVVGAAGGLGGFFPPLLMAAVKSTTGSYLLGFLLLGLTALACLAVLSAMRRVRGRTPSPAA